MRSPQCRTSPSLGAFALAALLAHGVPAFGSWTLTIPRLDPSTAAPFVDGDMDGTYGSGPSILYGTGTPPARVGALSTSTHFYICVAGMPRMSGSVLPFVSVAIDTDHDGASVPVADDIVFNLAEDGTKSAGRGDGSGGFPADPSITGWSAVRSLGTGTWSAELRIPLALLSAPDSPRAYPTVGIHVRHNGLAAPGDDHFWPPTATWNVPSTWAGVAWKTSSKPGETKVELDAYRITQGLDYDVEGGVAYDLIAGKDTLVRAQLFTLPGPAPDPTFAVCHFQRQVLSGPPEPLQTVPISLSTTPKVNTYSYGYLNGKPVFDFWIPGDMLYASGTYGFEIELGLEGVSGHQTVLLGHKVLKSSRDLRILLQRSELPPEDARFRAYDFAVNASTLEGLKHVQRLLPIRSSGLGDVLWSGGAVTAATPGLRYSYLPSIFRCPTGTETGKCMDTLARTQANEALKMLNAELAKKDKADGGHRDRFDKAVALVAEKVTRGGLCCVGDAVRASIDDNVGLISGPVIAHELCHSLGEVRTTSPHYVSISGGHSKSTLVSIHNNLGLVDTLSRTNQPVPLPLMVPGASAFEPATRLFHEGWEWNDLRSTSLAPVGGSFSVEPTFHLVGWIGPQGILEILWSARISDLDLELTAEEQNGSYEAVFLDPNQGELGRFHFSGDLTENDGAQPGTETLSLTTTFPPGSRGITILRTGSNLPIHSQIFSAAPPSIPQVIAAPAQQFGGIVLQWTAVDPDSQALAFTVYFQASQEDIPRLVAMGLHDTSFFFPTDTAPASQAARLVVEASDGFNTARAASNSFAIGARAPAATIYSPDAASDLVAGGVAPLLGQAFDATDGSLSGSAMRWTSSRQGFLGEGEEVHVPLAAGLHTIFLEATASSGLSDVAARDVLVQEDTDGDGLPDTYEAQLPCLSANLLDANDDPDLDGLASLAERANGTDPCHPDSDADGIGDGDEVRLGSHPLDAASVPAPDIVFLSADEVDLGACPDPETRTVVVNAPPNFPWRATAVEDWIVASVGPGGGCIEIGARCGELVPGSHEGQVLVSAPGAQLRIIQVRIESGSTPVGGLELPGDCNKDGGIDISDPVCLLGFLFLGQPQSLPCGDGTKTDPGNVRLLDHNADAEVDISDGIALLNYLFSSGSPPAAGTECTPIEGCAGHCDLGDGD